MVLKNLSAESVTKVNNEVINVHYLKHKDVITVGERSFRFESLQDQVMPKKGTSSPIKEAVPVKIHSPKVCNLLFKFKSTLFAYSFFKFFSNLFLWHT